MAARELFLRRPGAVDLVINPALGKAELVWVPAGCDLAGYLAEVERFGYRFGPTGAGRDRPSTPSWSGSGSAPPRP